MATPKLTKLHAALKVLSTAPYDAKAAQEAANEKIAEIKNGYEMFSDLWKNQKIDEIKAETNKKIQSLCDAMLTAAETVEANEEFEAQRLDMNDPKLTGAISLINLLGRDMDGKQQIDLLDSFKGDKAVLGVLKTLYDRNGLYYAPYAEELCKGVDLFALNGVKEACWRFNAGMGFDLGSTVFHLSEFTKAMSRFGLNPDANPYETALESVKFKRSEMTSKNLKAVAEARKLIENDTESTTTAEAMTRAAEIMSIVEPVIESE